MLLRSHHTLNLAATAYSPWLDVWHASNVAIQLDCGDVASPVGVVTVEASNDFETIEQERAVGTASASSAAVLIDITSVITVQGTVLATGYDGVGSKVSMLRLTSGGTIPAFVRIKYTKTSGGSGDTMHVRLAGRD